MPAAVGSNELPFNIPVEVEMIVSLFFSHDPASQF